ncbi:unnamed protein product [Darwinula stevensoni]|uniref:Uncharacterized protein n=1 Tax=Darwinula stevensoni TaxID=69355 RepID=A0A7R9A245_9CRUS|nr:unnamed protein product [Darwinula stevensoni]CAG0879099.1 unnamed protein product [Darwinula stevensoni]
MSDSIFLFHREFEPSLRENIITERSFIQDTMRCRTLHFGTDAMKLESVLVPPATTSDRGYNGNTRWYHSDFSPRAYIKHLGVGREERRRMAAQAYFVSLLLLVCLQWSSVDGQCGGDFTAPSGNFSSPNYPDNYDDNSFCVYEIDVGEGNGIELTFLDFELESGWDYVTITDLGTGESESHTGLLGSLGPLTFLYHNIQVTFESDSSFTYRGFYAEYESFLQPCDVSAGWEPHDGQCYAYFNEPKSAPDAQLDCEAIGGNLASIHGGDENSHIASLAQTAPLWIGLQRQGSDWEWLDGSPFDYDNFNQNPPFDDDYAVMWKDQWGNDDCRLFKSFVCRLRADECPDSTWIQEGSDCYLVVNDVRVFDSAVNYCENTSPPSALLTVPEDVDYTDVVASVLNGQELNEEVNIWIGIEKQGSTWGWVDDTTSELNNWAPGYPLEDAGKDCGTIIISTWHDSPGDNTFSFVCKEDLSRRLK